MPVKKFFAAMLSGIAFSTLALTGCGSGSKDLYLSNPAQLAAHLLLPPTGFAADTTPGASGQMTPELFAGFGGVGSAKSAGFVLGFKQGYINAATEEGLSITLIEFSSPAKAKTYLDQTARHTLSLAASTYSPYSQLPGATEVSGTKTYDGNYVHGVVDSTGRFYFSIVYADPLTSSVPTEFTRWAEIQWALLQPGVSIPQLTVPNTAGSKSSTTAGSNTSTTTRSTSSTS